MLNQEQNSGFGWLIWRIWKYLLNDYFDRSKYSQICNYRLGSKSNSTSSKVIYMSAWKMKLWKESKLRCYGINERFSMAYICVNKWRDVVQLAPCFKWKFVAFIFRSLIIKNPVTKWRLYNHNASLQTRCSSTTNTKTEHRRRGCSKGPSMFPVRHKAWPPWTGGCIVSAMHPHGAASVYLPAAN